VNPRDRLRSVSRRMTDPAEVLAQQVTERVLDLVVSALDVNELAARIDLNFVLTNVDLNALLARVDVNAFLARVDVNAFLARVDVKPLLDQVDVNELISHVDVNELVAQVDVNELVSRTDLGAAIASSTGGMGAEALDAVRSQAVGLDQFVDRWVQRLLRRRHPAPPAPSALLPAQAEP
jgi:hypothetical protein